jgi:hypothetical protein
LLSPRTITFQTKAQMKETEKLDLILQAMYAKRSENHFVDIVSVLAEPLMNEGLNNTQIKSEANRLGALLKRRGYVQMVGNMNTIGRITSDGVMYCEKDSFSSTGHSLTTLNLFQIKNSPNASVVNHSSNTTITIDNSNQLTEKLTQLESMIEEAVELTEDTKTELKDSLAEVRQAVEKGVSPKTALKYMFTLATGAGSVTELVQTIIQMLPK